MNNFRAAVVGLGKIGLTYDLEENREHPATHVYGYGMNPDVDLVCAVDNDIKRADILHGIFPEVRFYSDIKSLQNDGIDIVSICTPPKAHLNNIVEVLETVYPKIIFCEKPLVFDTGEIQKLAELMGKYPKCRLIPNISRRFNTGLQDVARYIRKKIYGELEKIHVRYTRGIYNTGSHLFDLLYMWTGKRISYVNALQKVCTSSENEGENSYSFFFCYEDGVTGYAEAINDKHYYVFEIDLFFTNGKISMKDSGDKLLFYNVQPHHAFQGFKELFLEKTHTDIMKESCMANAINNIVRVLEDNEEPLCKMEDAVYPLYVAEAVESSYNEKREVKVTYL
ncbi:MAG: Gfo/Idh/MocA family oxidoreductase [Selenomonadaceae bacterium]|nr:Gfo/Idh/MocA family oxidoreductase [Selenomonadaceae bacterium]